MNPVLSSKEFLLMQKIIEEQCGIALGEDKAYLVESRLSKLLKESSLTSFEELYHKINSGSDAGIVEKLIDAITTNETFWFRDKTPWSAMERILLPDYVQKLREGKKSRIRIWSAACSSGQEPYSVAMCIENYLYQRGISDIHLSNFEILATDISHTALQAAKACVYDNTSIDRGLDTLYKERYFTNHGKGWILDEKIRNAVCFQHFNLQNSFLFLGRFDVIFCRNVIIYFSDEFKKQLTGKLASSMEPQGVLFIGSSELFPDLAENFDVENFGRGVFYRLKS